MESEKGGSAGKLNQRCNGRRRLLFDTCFVQRSVGRSAGHVAQERERLREPCGHSGLRRVSVTACDTMRPCVWSLVVTRSPSPLPQTCPPRAKFAEGGESRRSDIGVRWPRWSRRYARLPLAWRRLLRAERMSRPRPRAPSAPTRRAAPRPQQRQSRDGVTG